MTLMIDFPAHPPCRVPRGSLFEGRGPASIVGYVTDASRLGEIPASRLKQMEPAGSALCVLGHRLLPWSKEEADVHRWSRWLDISTRRLGSAHVLARTPRLILKEAWYSHLKPSGYYPLMPQGVRGQ